MPQGGTRARARSWLGSMAIGLGGEVRVRLGHEAVVQVSQGVVGRGGTDREAADR